MKRKKRLRLQRIAEERMVAAEKAKQEALAAEAKKKAEAEAKRKAASEAKKKAATKKKTKAKKAEDKE